MTANHRCDPISRGEAQDSSLPLHNFPSPTPVHQPPFTTALSEDPVASIAGLRQHLERRIAADPVQAAVIIDALWEHAPELYDLVKRLAAFNPEMPCASLGLDGLIISADVLVDKIQRVARTAEGAL